MVGYWTAIDEGRFRDAQKVYSDSWPSKDSFPAQEATYGPSVDLKSLNVSTRTPPSNGVATLTMDVITYDRKGTDKGVCKHWGGWIRLVREGQEWRYLPGNTNWGRLSDPSASDIRCRRARRG
jgi:hypothetical protein